MKIYLSIQWVAEPRFGVDTNGIDCYILGDLRNGAIGLGIARMAVNQQRVSFCVISSLGLLAHGQDGLRYLERGPVQEASWREECEWGRAQTCGITKHVARRIIK